ncbi:D-glycero-beta-D-manno-heptose 1,7-bisphosphate 7-phosphatase [Gallaecimonas mangrovi]|uniref:D-glycero-beta-D-manno-heptose 1,7-bisphosphate 7-phosphatase n=1 Tax=Gallaecimonas mangrovi TaxID=2291597 RepID=UPI000E2094F5|nr:D-glycero-beta-D-manno-heptose 1,7-bisphosphate 7-phosphatase [Gallaecimonas mangrovi]
MRPALFLDRDGVINVDHGYVSKIDDFEFIDGVFDTCIAFKNAGYAVVVITNQSGIARGMYTEQDFQQLTQWMDWNFEDHGVLLDGVYYCPHHAEKGIGQYKVDCSCRKPKPGMILEAKADLDIDLATSIFVGDKADDMRAAGAAGVGTSVLVKTGKAVTEDAITLATVTLDSIADLPRYMGLKPR